MKNSKSIILEIVKVLLYTLFGVGIGIVCFLDWVVGIKISIIMCLIALLAFVAVMLYITDVNGNERKKLTRSSSLDNNARIERNNNSNSTSTGSRFSEATSVLDQKPLSAQKKEIREKNRTVAKKLVLINEEGSGILSWDLTNRSALIIGKSTDKEPVDVDLSVSAVAQMISKQHAVMNYTEKGWYIDDIDSKNGTRVKKHEQNAIMDVKLVGAVELEPGDIIYIANAMLQIQ